MALGNRPAEIRAFFTPLKADEPDLGKFMNGSQVNSQNPIKVIGGIHGLSAQEGAEKSGFLLC
jgi:hypothetical protein